MATNCLFHFDRPQPTFYSGELIVGRIELQTTKEINCKDVYIDFNGNAKTQIRHNKTNYSGLENYIQSRSVVYSGGLLQPGNHEYHFNIQLPLQCPASFKGVFGRIKYKLSLVINRPMRLDNTFHQEVTIVRHLNLNLKPQYLTPMQLENKKSLCFWPCSSGPVISTVILPYCAYAVGQPIRYSLKIENNSKNSDVLGFCCRLKQAHRFTVNDPYEREREKKSVIKLDRRIRRVYSLNNAIFQGEIEVPPVPATSDTKCLIATYYYLSFRIEMGIFHRKAKFKVPIIIGSEPLTQSLTDPWNVALTSIDAPAYLEK